MQFRENICSPIRQSREWARSREQIIEMVLNENGIKETARVLNISTSTVIKYLKKNSDLASINPGYKDTCCKSLILKVDEMWSYVEKSKIHVDFGGGRYFG